MPVEPTGVVSEDSEELRYHGSQHREGSVSGQEPTGNECTQTGVPNLQARDGYLLSDQWLH